MPAMIDPNLLCPKCMHISAVPERVCPRCRTDKTTVFNKVEQLQVGTILKNKYLIGGELGQGGFGITYCACDLETGVKMAVKEYFPNNCVSRQGVGQSAVIPYSGDAEAFFLRGLERFAKEAESLARFAHLDCVIGVRDFFRANGTAYIVMDFAEGMSLKAATAKQNIGFDTLLQMMKPLMDDLCVIHEQNIIHRDIKPDNIMVSPAGKAVLIDFGAARSYKQGGNSTKLGVVHDYAPLEQHLNEPQGPWTDVYALCATLYEQATGHMVPGALDRLLNKKPVPKPSALGVKLPKHVEDALMAGLALQAKDRTQSVRQLRDGLYQSRKKKSGGKGWIAGGAAAAAVVLVVALLAAGSGGPAKQPVYTQIPGTTTAVQHTQQPAPVATAVPTQAPTATPKPQVSNMQMKQAVLAGGELFLLDGKQNKVVRCFFANGNIQAEQTYDTSKGVRELRQSDGVVYGLDDDGMLWIQDGRGAIYSDYPDHLMDNYWYLTDAQISDSAIVLLLGADSTDDNGEMYAYYEVSEKKSFSYGRGNASYWIIQEKRTKQNRPVFVQANSKVLNNMTAVALQDSFGVAVVENPGNAGRDGQLYYWGTPPAALRTALNLNASPDVARQYNGLKGYTLKGNDLMDTTAAGRSVIALGSETLAAITDSGAVLMAGANDRGQLGLPVDTKNTKGMQAVPLDLGSDTPSQVFCMDGYTLLLTQSGALYGWGANDQCQLGLAASDVCQPTLLMRGVADFSPSDSGRQVLVTTAGELVTFGGGMPFTTLMLSNGG